MQGRPCVHCSHRLPFDHCLLTCRETERTEFSEAKDRLKHSWAADRDDFARVKEALKKKNTDHHVQNGRLSQALKVRPVFRTAPR